METAKKLDFSDIRKKLIEQKDRFNQNKKEYIRAELDIIVNNVFDDQINFLEDLQVFFSDYQLFVTQQTLKPEGV